ncbi:hypothetical protein Cob_v002552 [Colletotrichum orbiculare MAFF 240422]|uniref:Uncharacterized protein n=1 Tax=Colletotrichum orbiculare (strain 104-T / ATCC 96160 / CBS 514.97 / LARS 414 / MAFF 240422) TaxID=1213857 RepID=A0A484G2F4_COLOR|nr:hypothetical protein Cob_v002552 [Colletotrichum orbiculare MAFF 240422]
MVQVQMTVSHRHGFMLGCPSANCHLLPSYWLPYDDASFETLIRVDCHWVQNFALTWNRSRTKGPSDV